MTQRAAEDVTSEQPLKTTRQRAGNFFLRKERSQQLTIEDPDSCKFSPTPPKELRCGRTRLSEKQDTSDHHPEETFWQYFVGLRLWLPWANLMHFHQRWYSHRRTSGQLPGPPALAAAPPRPAVRDCPKAGGHSPPTQQRNRYGVSRGTRSKRAGAFGGTGGGG